MAISQWRLPPELGGAVVNPMKITGSGHPSAYRVRVPGTAWTIDVPGECLVAVLPLEPPVNSVVLAVRGQAWSIFQRRDDKVALGWACPGGATVSNWQGMHQEYDKLHVLLWWGEDAAEAGVTLPAGRGSHSFVIVEPGEDEPGVAALRIAEGLGKYAYLDRDSAVRAAGALLGLAMKEWM